MVHGGRNILVGTRIIINGVEPQLGSGMNLIRQ